MKKRNKYMTVLVKVPAGTAALSLVEGLFVPDRSYGHIDGVAISIGLPGTLQGPSYVDVGLRDTTQGVIHDPCHIENWQANAGVNPNDKFKDVFIPSDGRNVFCQVFTPAIATADFNIQFIFRLIDELTEIARV